MCENSHHDEKFTGLAQNSQVGPAISQLKISIRGLKLAQNMCQPVKVTFNSDPRLSRGRMNQFVPQLILGNASRGR